MKFQDRLFTGIGVLTHRLCRRSCVLETTRDSIVRRRGKRKDNFNCGFLSRILDTGKRRHVSNSDVSRQQVWSNGSDVL